jgi:translation elongation factor EF-Tu-like GTPase
MSKTIRITIKEKDLRRLVSEEVKAIREDVDPDGVRNVVNTASKLLKTARDFKEKATGAMTNATTPHLDSIIAALSSMIETPSSYVDKPERTQKTVQLRKVD